MFRFTLHPDDATRLDVPETLELDLDRPRLSEIRALREQVGMSWSDLLSQLHGDAEGADQLYAAGIVYWLAIVRAGGKIAWRDCEVIEFLGVELVDPLGGESGNSPAPDGA